MTAALSKPCSIWLGCYDAIVRHETGVTALEYGLIAGPVAVVIVTPITALGTKLSTTFAAIAAALR